MSYKSGVVCESMRVQNIQWPAGSASLNTNHQLRIELVAPLSREAINFIETRRDRDDIDLQLDVRYQFQKIRIEGNRQLSDGEVFWLAGGVNLLAIPRSEWLKRLAEMKWGEIELFEINVGAFAKDKHLTISVELLREAEDRLRNGDYGNVLAKCREAFESAAKHAIQGDKVKQGFDLLLARVFPDDPDKAKLLDGVIRSISDYAQLGRHAQYPTICISREEAEFGLTTTLGMFSMLSRRLAASQRA